MNRSFLTAFGVVTTLATTTTTLVDAFCNSPNQQQQHPCAYGHQVVGCAPARQQWILRSSVAGDEFYNTDGGGVSWEELLEETLETAAFVATKQAMAASESLMGMIASKIPKELLPKKVGVPHDLSEYRGVPYDAASMSAYFAWCHHFDKTPSESPNSEAYLNFKANYERITIANVIAKKNFRESGGNPPTPILLNQFADVPPQEYEELSRPPTWNDIIGRAMNKAVTKVKELVPATLPFSEAPKQLASSEKWSAAPKSFLSFLQSRASAGSLPSFGTLTTSKSRTPTSRLLFDSFAKTQQQPSNNKSLSFLFASLTANIPPHNTDNSVVTTEATISWWMQNSDGSITGRLSNAEGDYRNGSWIRTSPVLQKAESGSLVKTQSGSTYWLK